LDKFNSRPDFIKPAKLVQKVELNIETGKAKIPNKIKNDSSQMKNGLFTSERDHREEITKFEYNDENI
jgi:hypothetical protein